MPPPASSLPETRIEVVAIDKDGRPVDGLRPADLTVTIDGVARPVVSIRRVSRGPGASADAARRMGTAGQDQSFAAEPIRNVMVVIDQSLILRGEEKAAVQASRAFLDRLGLGDRVAVVRLPFSTDQSIELTSERPAAREALALVRGQAVRTSLARQEASPIERPPVLDPDQVTETQPTTQELASPGIAVGTPEAEFANARTSLAALTGILRSLQQFQGRKVIAVFSPGFQGASIQALADASAAAIAGGATVYAFGLPSLQDDPQSQPDSAGLQTLAKNTGGAWVMLGKSPEKVIERAMDDLSAVYVLSVAAGASDRDGKRRPVKVLTPRKDVTLRAPAWLLPAADPQDVVPEAPQEAPAPAAGVERRARSACRPACRAPGGRGGQGRGSPNRPRAAVRLRPGVRGAGTPPSSPRRSSSRPPARSPSGCDPTSCS